MRTFLFFLLLLGFLSCKKEPTIKEPTTSFSDALLPLAVGNQWRYQVTTIDSTASPGSIHTVDTVVVECSQTIVRNGVTYYMLTSSQGYRWGRFMLEDLVWVDGTCHAYNPHYNVTYSPPGSPYLKYPTSVGESWYWNEPYRSYKYEVMAVDTSVTVLGGVFTEAVLMKLAYSGGSGSYNERIEVFMHYQPEVGLVKQVYTEKHIPVLVEIVMELIDYTVQ